MKLELLTDVDMLLIVEKDIRRGTCNAIHQHAKLIMKIWKIIIKKKNIISKIFGCR